MFRTYHIINRLAVGGIDNTFAHMRPDAVIEECDSAPLAPVAASDSAPMDMDPIE